MASRVAVLGDIFVDVQVCGVQALPQWGADQSCESVRIVCGGSAANCARQMASISGDRLSVSLFSAVGDDELGAFFLRTVEQEGLLQTPHSTIVKLPKVPQSTCVVLSGPVDRAMVSCYSSVGTLALNHLTGRGLFAVDAAEGEQWRLLHIGGYFNCPGLHAESMLKMAKELRDRGGLISLDPQHDCTAQWTGTDGHLRRLLALVDVVMPNEVEAMGMSGKADVHEALEALAISYPSLLIVIKWGEHGALAARGEQRWRCYPYETRVVDTTGAGDAFSAGFLPAYLANPEDVAGALRSGCAVGALAVQSSGACTPPLTPALVANFTTAAAKPKVDAWKAMPHTK